MYQVNLFNLQHFIMSWKILGPFDFDSNTSQKTTRWNKVVVLTRNIRSLRRQGIEKSTLESFSGVKMKIITFKDCCWRRGCTVRKCPRFCEKCCCHQIKNYQIFPLVHFPSLNIWWFVLNTNKIFFSAQAHTGFTIILLWSKDKTESHDFYFYSTKSLQLLTQGSLFVCKDQQAALAAKSLQYQFSGYSILYLPLPPPKLLCTMCDSISVRNWNDWDRKPTKCSFVLDSVSPQLWTVTQWNSGN